MIQNVTALRRGQGKDFLVYGRMLRPADIDGNKMMEWTSGSRNNRIPAVFHSAWQTPDGRFGIVIANWTDSVKTIAIKDGRLGGDVCFHAYGGKNETPHPAGSDGRFMVEIPPLGCGLMYRMTGDMHI